MPQECATLAQTGDRLELLKYLGQLTKRDPDDLDAALELSKLRNELGDSEGAARELERANRDAGSLDKKTPQHANSHALLAALLVKQERLAEAEVAARRALELEPHNLNILRMLAALARHAARFAEAHSYYAEIGRLDPRDADARLGQAVCSAAQGHRVLAELMLEGVLQEHPNHAKALTLQAELNSSYPPESGITHALAGENLEVLRSIGVALSKQEAPETVLPRLLHQKFEAHALLAALLVKQERLAEAEVAARRALELEPHNLNILRMLAALARHAARFAEAHSYYAEIGRLDPRDADARLGQAVCSAAQGHRVLAELMLEGVLQEHPNHAKALTLQAELNSSYPPESGITHALAGENLEVLRSIGVALSKQDAPETVLHRLLHQKFEELGPWYTRFTVHGKDYGGVHSYVGDCRLRDFFEWQTGIGRVLELGSFEGAHSFAITEDTRVQSLIGLEGRDFLLARANFIKELLGNRKTQFVQCDFEKDDIAKFGPVDIVFCSGLLYHLSRPWSLIEAISRISPRLFLSTHYAEKEEVTRLHYRGILYKERSHSDPLSGLVDAAFWPSFKHLSVMLADHGFRISKIRDYPSWPNGPVVNLYCEK